jgi:hypothetical protein
VTDPLDELAAALEPVRRALLARARADADAARAAAGEQAQAAVGQARARVERLVAQARSEGETDAAVALAAARARARRRARSVVLAAQRAAYEELRARARVEAARLAGDVRRRTEDLGPGRQLLRSSEALADAALDALGPELEKLWSP